MWPDILRPISFGSLLKPFLALAFSATHSTFPTIVCRGSRDRCWFSNGHGSQDIVSALANSCNCYFLSIAGRLDLSALDEVCLSRGVALPSRSLEPAALIGLAPGWRNSPSAVAHAFSHLARDVTPRQSRSEAIFRGMAQCALRGTARNLHLSCYAKTGTAPCSHQPRAAGDGFVVLIHPLDQPRCVLLLERHGTTGAEACRDVRERINSL